MSANIENLVLMPGAVSGTGNDLDNALTGNSGNNVLTGGAGNDWLDGSAGNDTLVGGTGDDTYVVNSVLDVITENAAEGSDTVITQGSWTLGANLENLTLTGTAAVNGTGNALANTLTGNSNANTLDGGGGADTMRGGLGNDIYVVDDIGDVVTENTNEGTDLVQSAIGYTLGSNVENLTLTGTAAINGTGNALNNVLTGNSGANVLIGGDGNDVLVGGGGADIMMGGAGHDTYYVNNVGDAVTEQVAEGIDGVFSSITQTLGANVENLTLTGAGVVNGTGNELDNVLTGNSAANVLDGGAGIDTLIGGAGNDTYVVNNGADSIIENANEGTDLVQSSASYTLSANVENLTLTGTAAINATGNSASNTLTGNAGNNVLDGGAGTDTLVGGAGDDTYVVDVATDVVTEAASAGLDTILSSVTYTASANVENLTLTGTAAINATGNTLDNVLTGNAASNVLSGGTGADTMIGGDGNDTYVVDNIADVVTENANEGIDLIQSSVTFALSANVENLTLTGTGVINGTGNELDNVLTGNGVANVLTAGAGNDTLNGGAGSDTLIGGSGNDTYVVDVSTDVITEYAGEGTDLVQSAATYTLSANVENLTLTGTAIINGTGNALDNIIVGNSAANTLTGGAGNDTLDGGAGTDAFNGGAGDDKFIVDVTTEVVTEALNEGTDTVMASVSYTLGANVENLTLTGTAAINATGNTLANVLIGNSANNTLNGEAGADTMLGGQGDDIYVVNDLGDLVSEATGEGTDLVQSAIGYTLGSNVENLTLTGTAAINGTGNALNNVLTGNSGVNVLSGGDGNDTLNGGTGVDTLIGGSGDDTYIVEVSNEIVTEAGGEGTDLVQSSVTFALSANVEKLTLTGTAAINGTGNELDNVLTGNGVANVLDGGAGIDTLIGGAGNDTYVVNNGADSIIENANEGTDLVQSSASYTLSANVENLTLTGTAAINATGNSASNTLTGNAGNNVLDGGAGTDTLVGGAGDDTYVVDVATDVVTEAASAGLDTILSSVTYTASANVENLTLTGTAAINATGNTLDNVLTGNAASNVLSGGTGADTMIGGDGNDTYVVDNIADVVTENANEGIDLIQSSVTFALSANVENLTLTGTGVINGTGNELDNVLTGNGVANVLTAGAGNDTLNGGAGSDTLIGGSGNDTYVVDVSTDVITEYAGEGTDLVQSAATYTLSANVENLTLTGTAIINGTGNALDNIIVGNSAANTLTGGAGNDTLDGGAGTDAFNGGAGDDNFIVDVTTEVVTEALNEGTDTVMASVSYTLGANVENLTLTGTAAINATGNTLANVLIGNSANNTLNGEAGADTMLGGQGDDIYVVNDLGDLVSEATGEGTDLVQSAIGYTLGSNVENLTLTGTAAINGTGNALNNVLTGNSGVNVLSGGDGNDTYVVDNIADVVTENANEGIDLIQSSVTFALSANVENLTLTGTGVINGTGNELDNVLTGNGVANVLTAGAGNDTLNGGAGSDTLIGGSGNDTYVVDVSTDVITEYAGEGTDLVQSAATYTLSANVENLTLTGTAIINGTGNALDNIIVGNSAANTLTGGAGNDTLDGGAGTDAFNGGAGDDKFIVDVTTEVVTEALNEGTDTVMASVSYTLGANVENLTLTGTTAINATGNTLANVLIGNSANNTLNGEAGADTMLGGQGDDIYVVNDLGDLVSEATGEGTDLVQSAIGYTLGSNVENLTLTGTAAINGTGNALNNVLTGNSGVNVLSGGDGNDTLNGGTGVDTLIGGSGDDTYIVEVSNEIVTEAGGEGTDLVQSSVTFALSANVEKLTLTGTAAINGTGNELDNVLTGNGVANVLDGGAGIDTLIGGAGNDTYVVNNGADSIIENANEGTDLVQSSASYTLSANVENLTLTGTAAINATGNSASNTLTGNAGNNVLDGGAGTDTLVGGAGDDTYVVDVATDVVTEAASAGLDTILSSVTYTASANVENLTLTGTAAINATGNTLDNVLTGNAASNVLSGGTGADTMIGGDGNDTYVVDNIADVVTENANEGIDLIQSSVTFALSANVENLTLTGTGVINGTGNELDNVLTGNGVANVLTAGAGNDTLNGGAGSDTLIGGSGNDTYVVDVSTDVITEYAGEGTDLVQSAATYTLSANVENLTLTGTAIINGTGNALDNIIVGNSAANTLTGGAGNDTLDGGAGTDAFNGGAGDDNFIVDVTTEVVTEALNEGTDTVMASVSYTLGANVENLTLTGTTAINATGNTLANVLIGNSANNTLNGGAGNDTLDGGAGADQLIGGAGDDVFRIDNVSDVVIEAVDEGWDRVESSINLSLALNIEELVLLGNATIGIGNIQNNRIVGNALDNLFAGGIGADALLGGKGNDTYIFSKGDGTDTIDDNDATVGNLDTVEFTNVASAEVTALLRVNNDLVLNYGASDSVRVSSYFTGTSQQIEQFKFSNGVTWTDANIKATVITNGTSSIDHINGYNGGTNRIYGLDGNDYLYGGNQADLIDGGAGADSMAGGLGNDTYVVNSASDQVIENANAGIDTIRSSITYTLGSEVENLVLTGSTPLDGRGNALENHLVGNSGGNTLYGDATGTSGNTARLTTLSVFARGSIALGAAPLMEVWIDGVKTQTFEVTSTTTQEYVISAANLPATAAHRVDVVFTNDAYDAATGQDRNLYVNRLRFNGRDYLTNTDQLVLDYGAGTGARDGINITLSSTGVIASNSALRFSLDGSDRLDGGAGADTLVGGTGDDIYYVDNVSDAVVELSGQGFDTVRSSVNHTLAAHVDNLMLTGSAVSGTGNDLANLILGNSGNNTLDGGAGTDSLRGGVGADTLIGGAGNDILEGSVGNDTYRFSRGHGQDSIWDSDTTVGNEDVLSFDSTVAHDQLWFKKVGNNLEVSVIGTTDKLTVSNWYVSSQWHVEQVAASDKILVDTQVQALVNAMASMTPPPLGQTALSAAQVSALQPVLASSWQ